MLVRLALDAQPMSTVATHLAPYVLAGFVAGMLYFGALRWMTWRLARPGGRAWGWLGLLQAIRIAALTALLLWAAHRGGGPLLALAVGVMSARLALVRRVRSALRLGR